MHIYSSINAYKVEGTMTNRTTSNRIWAGKGWKANKLKHAAIKINELPVPPKGNGLISKKKLWQRDYRY